MFRSAVMMGNRAAAGGGFTPADISPLRWLDFTDTSTMFQDSGKLTPASANNDPIYVITDKGSIAADLSVLSGTSTLRPLLQLSAINGHSAALFDGVDDILISTPDNTVISQPCEIWLTMKQVTTVNGQYISSNERWSATDNWEIRQGTWPFTNGVGLNVGVNTSLDWGLVWKVVRFFVNGASSTFTINDGTPQTADYGTQSLNGMTIGSKYTGASSTNILVADYIIAPQTSAADEASMWSYYSTLTGLF